MAARNLPDLVRAIPVKRRPLDRARRIAGAKVENCCLGAMVHEQRPAGVGYREADDEAAEVGVAAGGVDVGLEVAGRGRVDLPRGWLAERFGYSLR